MDFVKKHQDAISTGIISVALAVVGKKIFKKELLSSSSTGNMAISVVTISVAGIAANEIRNKYPIT